MIQEIRFTRYSEFDDIIIANAPRLGLPLIGGTALEILADYFMIPDVRKRSDNDLDFIVDNFEQKEKFENWIKQNIKSNRVKIDIMFIQSHTIPKELIIHHKSILVMAPEYIIWSKLQRATPKDIEDIIWLFNATTPDKLEHWLQTLGVTDLEIDRINAIIETINR